MANNIDIVTNDQRRFRIIPLKLSNIERAAPGELVTDLDTGDIYVIDEEGNPKCRTNTIEQAIQELVLTSDMNTLFYMNNRNRRVYRFFFTERTVRLDVNLILDSRNYFYRIRSMEDNTYYVSNLTPIKETAECENVFENNKLYYVEFYNQNRELVSMLPFSAKAIIIGVIEGEGLTTFDHIEIETNRDFLYIGEDPSHLLIRIIGYYSDGTSVDVTEYSAVTYTLPSSIDTSELGEVTLHAYMIYNYDTTESLDADYTIRIVDNNYIEISDMIVIPKKIITLNDQSQAIRLSVFVYYSNGTCVDVSDECIITNFDPTLFNTSQNITVKFDSGTEDTIEKVYNITVYNNGSSSNYYVYFNNNLLKLDSTRSSYPLGSRYYRVRCGDNINEYYTDYIVMYTTGVFSSPEDKPLVSNTNVIVEFYDENYNLIDSDVYTCIISTELE